MIWTDTSSTEWINTSDAEWFDGNIVIITLPLFTVNSTSRIHASGEITLPIMTIISRVYNGSVPECIVMNTKNFAVSEYLNYGFNSMTRFNGVNLIADQNGVYAQDTSDADDGVYKIKVNIKSGTIDTYKERIQRLRNGWLNYQTDGDVRLKTTANKTKTRTYNLSYINVQDLDTMIERRIKFERGIKDRYFDFKIENVNGSSLEIDKLTITLEPIIKKRR